MNLDREARAAARGDRVAFERLYRGSVARVHSLARRLVGRERADEATQEVYLRAWRGLASWRGEASVTTWLHSLARNTLLSLASRELAAELGREGDLDQALAPAVPLALRFDLEAAIARLPAGARAVFVLHDVEGLEHAAVARELGIAVGTSKSQLARARMLLRASLGEGHAP